MVDMTIRTDAVHTTPEGVEYTLSTVLADGEESVYIVRGSTGYCRAFTRDSWSQCATTQGTDPKQTAHDIFNIL